MAIGFLLQRTRQGVCGWMLTEFESIWIGMAIGTVILIAIAVTVELAFARAWAWAFCPRRCAVECM